MKTLITIVFSFLLLSISKSQNLVPNPGFENYNNTFCGIMMNADFASVFSDWILPTGGNSDVYFTNIDPSCYNFQPDSQFDGPIGIKGSQLPRTGEVMTGAWLYTIDGLNQREYIQIQLTEPLIPGNSYRVEFYISLADNMEYSIDKIGAYLSPNQISGTDDGPLTYTPQISTSDFVDETEEWVLISEVIVADAEHQFLTIGNFNDDDNTNVQANPSASGAPGTYGAYYFIDDVKVEAVGNPNRVNDPEFSAQIIVSPNPTFGFLKIEISAAADQSILEIYHSSGQLIHSQNRIEEKTTIDCSDYPAGLYFLKIKKKEKVAIKRFIKS